MEFHQMNIDDRLTKSVSLLGWEHPTAIQEKCIPLVLEGKDVLVRAKTGSGKTASYALPMIQKILDVKVVDSQPKVAAVVLVPSKELCYQATANIRELCNCLSDAITVINLSTANNSRSSLLNVPDVAIATPSRLLSLLQSNVIDLKDSLKMVVLDEADLMFSFGYEEDIKTIARYLPVIYQTVLVSATLSDDVLALKKLVLNNPVTVKLEEPLVAEDRLVQYYIRCGRDDKYLLMYALLKLKLVRGKTLVFVNEINNCYRLKLFLEQFFIKACVLNSELPQNSRYHVVEQFNSGVYDYVVATDEVDDQHRADSKKRKKREHDKDYSVSRGIDFQSVDNIINFDCPPSVDSYVHRIGRTARGFDYGTALTLVDKREEALLERLQEELKKDDLSTETVKPYKFKMSEIEGFRYRVQDAIRNVSAVTIREARLKEIRREIVASEKLKTHFKENPRDLEVLKHDRVLLPRKTQNHLKHIPSYLVPKVIKENPVPAAVRQRSSRGRVTKPKKNNPLKSFKMSTT